MPCITVIHPGAVLLLIWLCGMVAAYACSCSMDEELDVAQKVFIFCAIVLFGVVALGTPVMDCSKCLKKGTVTQMTIDSHIREYADLKSRDQQYFGKNSDLWMLQTSNGAVAKWPNCYNDITDKWDACKVQEVIEIELTCKKN